MKYLLDTCACLWYLESPDKLSRKVIEALLNRENDIYVSLASAWEIGIKVAKGTLEFEGGVAEFCYAMSKNGFQMLPIEQSHIEPVQSLPFHHKDPFDRLIISVALSENMTLLTADENIHKYEVEWIW